MDDGFNAICHFGPRLKRAADNYTQHRLFITGAHSKSAVSLATPLRAVKSSKFLYCQSLIPCAAGSIGVCAARLSHTSKMLMSEGETPEILAACPTVPGRIFVNFWRASLRKLGTVE